MQCLPVGHGSRLGAVPVTRTRGVGAAFGTNGQMGGIARGVGAAFRTNGQRGAIASSVRRAPPSSIRAALCSPGGWRAAAHEKSDFGRMGITTPPRTQHQLGRRPLARLAGSAGESDLDIYEEVEVKVSTLTLLKFVLPTLAIWVLNPILGLIDTAVVGQASAVELAALGPGVMLCDHVSYGFNFLSIATTNLLAIAFARGDKGGAEKVLTDSFWVAAGFGAAMAVVYFALAPVLLGLLTGPAGAELIPAATAYVRFRAPGVLAALMSSIMMAFFLAAKNPVTALKAVVAAAVLNGAGDVFFCSVLGWGIGGAAAATTLSQFLGWGLLLRALGRPQAVRKGSPAAGWSLDIKGKFPNPGVSLKLLRFAGPVAIVLWSKILIYSILNVAASRLGAVGTGAHHVAFSVFLFFAVFGDAVSMAGQAYLPAAIGRPKASRGLGKRLMATGAVVGAGNSALAAAILTTAGGLFSADPAVLATIRSLTPMVCASLFVHTTSMATEGILMAGRDFRHLVASYGINLAMVVAAFRGSAGVFGAQPLTAVWIGIITFVSVRLVLNTIRLASPASVLNSEQALKEAAT